MKSEGMLEVKIIEIDRQHAHENIKFLSGLDLTNYDLISCTKEGFVSAVLKPMENRYTYFYDASGQ